MNSKLSSRANEVPAHSSRRGIVCRRIIIVAQPGPVPEYLLSLVRAAGDQGTILPELDGVLRHIKDPADVVIVGISAWGAEGIDVVAKTRAALPAVPLIAVSGTSLEDLYLHFSASEGAARVLVQPFTPDALKVAVESAFAQKSARTASATTVTLPSLTTSQR